MIEALDADGTMAKLLDKYQIPMKSGYMGTNVTDPSVRKENVANVIRIAKLVKKYGGTYLVIAVNGRRPQAAGRGAQQQPDTFNYLEHKADMVAALNDYGMAVNDAGL